MAPKKERVLHKRLRNVPRENFRNTFPRLKVSPTVSPSTIPEDSSGNSGNHTSTTAYPHYEVPRLSRDQYDRSVSSFSSSTSVQTQYHIYPDVPNPNYVHPTLAGRQPTSFPPYDDYGENSPTSYTSPNYAAGAASTLPRPSHDITGNPLASGVCLAGHPGVNIVTRQCSRCSSAPTSHYCCATRPLTTGDDSGQSRYLSDAALYLPSTQIHVSEPHDVFTSNYEHTPLQHLPSVIIGGVPGQNEYLEEYTPGYYGGSVTQWPQSQDYHPDSDEDTIHSSNNGYGQAMNSSRYD